MIEYIKENKKIVRNAVIILIAIIISMAIFLYFSINSESDVDKFNNTVIATIENIKSLDLKDSEYILIKFPDKEQVISKNGKIKSSTNKKYNQFEKGYAIIYKDGSYSFKLSSDGYCAIKDYNEDSINIVLYQECEDYIIEYK